VLKPAAIDKFALRTGRDQWTNLVALHVTQLTKCLTCPIVQLSSLSNLSTSAIGMRCCCLRGNEVHILISNGCLCAR